MKRILYSVAMSLDGYIAGPNGEADWIIMDPDIDFDAMWSRFDTLLMGRRTFEPMARTAKSTPSIKTVVISTTLQQEDYPNVTVIGENVEQAVAALREESGKDIWLFGGGVLFQRLLEANLVDGVEIGVIPVLLGGGIPMLATPAVQAKLKLTKHHVYKSGIVGLEYDVSSQAS